MFADTAFKLIRWKQEFEEVVQNGLDTVRILEASWWEFLPVRNF